MRFGLAILIGMLVARGASSDNVASALPLFGEIVSLLKIILMRIVNASQWYLDEVANLRFSVLADNVDTVIPAVREASRTSVALYLDALAIQRKQLRSQVAQRRDLTTVYGGWNSWLRFTLILFWLRFFGGVQFVCEGSVRKLLPKSEVSPFREDRVDL
jgi:hypothetical protein